MIELLNPAHWPPPRGYTNTIVARGDIVFVAGQVGWTRDGKFPAKDLVGQVRQTLLNIQDALAPSGAKLTDVVRLTWFITAKSEYLDNIKEVGAVYREIMGKHYPVMSVVEVKSLVESEAKVEIEATAVVPR